MKTKLLFLSMFWIGFMSFSQNTYVPDEEFELFLINMGYDSLPLDNYVPTANINTVTYLEIQFLPITDLTGIEDFSALEILRCNFLEITSLDVSQNTALTWLDCIDNQLTSLDISQNTLLTTLDCQINQLASLDVSNNALLTNLSCSGNNISNLDLSQNPELINLSCSDNQLTSLDLSQNSELKFLDCNINQLSSLDLSQNPLLTNINCYNNQLTNLDISQNLDLIFLYCQDNLLSSLDVSSNNVLSQLSCEDNQLATLDLTQNTQIAVLIAENNDLTSLNVKNGNNNIINTFRTTGNPNLTCIDVDDAAYSTTNWTNIDSQTSFSENCPELSVEELETSKFTMHPNPVVDKLTINLNEEANYSLINLTGKVLKKGKLVKGKNEVNLYKISSGLYFIKVETNAGATTKKLIKQ
jgi:Leucine-rich repeat (LRR) protein